MQLHPEPENYPWGIATSWRGLKYHEQAVSFIAQHPIGTVLENSRLVEIGQKLFDCDPDGYYPPSFFARKLTTSGTHPRMEDDAFAVVLTIDGSYKVVEPLDGWQRFDMGDVLEKKIRSLLRFHDFKLQGKSWPELPPSVEKCIRRVYREYQRAQELNTVLHGPIIEALEDLKEVLRDL